MSQTLRESLGKGDFCFQEGFRAGAVPPPLAWGSLRVCDSQEVVFPQMGLCLLPQRQWVGRDDPWGGVWGPPISSAVSSVPSPQFSFSRLAALAWGGRGSAKKHNEKDEPVAKVMGLRLGLQSPPVPLCGQAPSPGLCADPLPQLPSWMDFTEHKAAKMEGTLGLTGQVEKLGLREGIKCSGS